MRGKKLWLWGAGVGSVTKAVVIQVWGLGSLSPYIKDQVGIAAACSPSAWKAETGGPWGKLAKVRGQISRLWVYWEIRFRMIHPKCGLYLPTSWRPRWNKRGKGHQPCRTSASCQQGGWYTPHLPSCSRRQQSRLWWIGTQEGLS